MFTPPILFLAGLIALVIPGSSAKEYLYDGDINAKPVIEYLKPVKTEFESLKEYDSRINHPNFLASEGNGPRFVEFYAPWCPHCRHFKSKYVAIAQKISAMNTSSVKFYAVSCTMHNIICNEHGIHSYPTVKYFSARNNTGVLIPYNEHNLKGMENYVASEIDAYSSADSGIKNDKKIRNNISLNQRNTQTHPVEKAHLYIDATSSFMFTLRKSIFMTLKALSKSEADAFENWLRLLYDTLPDTMDQARDTILILLDNISEVVQSEDKFLDVLSSRGVDIEITSRKGWTTSCASGYTCGLWELFHIMTIGLVVKNGKNSKKIPTMHAAESLARYIEYFFPCQECRYNFLAVYDSCSFDRCNRLDWNETTGEQIHWKQLPLWLWEVHNDVNTRLIIEKNTRLGLPKPNFEEQQIAMWPTRKDCEKCWNADGTWEEDEVYSFLYQYYWPLDSEKIQRHPHVAQNDVALLSIWQESKGSFVSFFTLLLLALWLTVRKRKWNLDVSGHHKKADDLVV